MEERGVERIKVVEKAVTILDLIRESNRPLGVNEVSRQCGVSLTTAFRILKTLKYSGWVYQDENDQYIVGHKISYVTNRNNFYVALKEVAYFSMARLTAATSQAMNLIIRENEKCFILQQSRTAKIVDYVPPIGTTVPLYASAGGKILLSELDQHTLDEILSMLDFRPLTRYTITRPAVLIDELAKCREDGYALDARESQEEGFCIAVPVRDPSGRIIAALSFSGIIGSIQNSEIAFYNQQLQKGAAEISQNLFCDRTGE